MPAPPDNVPFQSTFPQDKGLATVWQKTNKQTKNHLLSPLHIAIAYSCNGKGTFNTNLVMGEETETHLVLPSSALKAKWLQFPQTLQV